MSAPPEGAERRSAAAWAIAGVALAAASPAALEVALGYVRAGSDLGWFFLPLWSWWWGDPRPFAGWNPWLFAGFPAAADPQLGVWHPLTVLYGVLPPLAAASLEGALGPAVAAAGMLLYLRRVGAGHAGSALGALSFAMGGFVAAHAPHPSIVRAAMVLPWGLLAIESLAGSRLAAALAGVVGALLLAGQPQVSALGIALLGLYALVLGRPLAARRWAWLGAGFALGVALGAASWLPAAELVAASTRSVRAPVFPNPTLSLADMALLVVPFAGGGGIGPLGGGERSGLACGLIECSGYPGVLAWVALVGGAGWLARDARGRFWLAAAVAGLAVATGIVPLPTGIRGPARMLLWWNVAVAGAAGLGLGAVLARPWRWSGWIAGLAAILLVAVALGATLPPARSGALLGTAVALAVTSLALLLARRGASAALWLPAALAVDLLIFALTMMAGGITPAAFAEMRAPAIGLRETVDDRPCPAKPLERVLVLDPPLSIDWASVLEVRSVQGYDPLVLRGVAELLDQLGHGLEAIGWVADPSLAAPANRALDVLRVGLVLRDVQGTNPLGVAIAALARAGDPRWEPAPGCSRGGREAYFNRRVRPVAWLVEDAIAADDAADAAARVRGGAGEFDVERRVAIAGLAPGAAREAAGAAEADSVGGLAAGTVRVDALASASLRLTVEARAASWLVTSEIAYPGWHATVDGTPTPLLVANGAFRALRVPAGVHHVELAFRPRTAVAGAAVSGLCLLALAALVAAGGRRAGGA